MTHLQYRETSLGLQHMVFNCTSFISRPVALWLPQRLSFPVLDHELSSFRARCVREYASHCWGTMILWMWWRLGAFLLLACELSSLRGQIYE